MVTRSRVKRDKPEYIEKRLARSLVCPRCLRRALYGGLSKSRGVGRVKVWRCAYCGSKTTMPLRVRAIKTKTFKAKYGYYPNSNKMHVDLPVGALYPVGPDGRRAS